MPVFDQQYYADRVQTPTPGHQPIYPQVPLNWITHLTTQVSPRNLRAPGAASPVLLGAASRSGAILESIFVASIEATSPTGGGGYGGGGLSSTADWGFGTSADPLILNIYTRREPDEDLSFFIAYDLFSAAQSGGGSYYARARFTIDILPQPEVAWRLEPSQEVYVALNKPMREPGLNVFVFGGHYS